MTYTVLCAIDINRPTEEIAVLRTAKQQADLNNAQLDVMTVMPDYGHNVVGLYLATHDVETAEARAVEKLNEFCTDVLGAEANAHLRHLVAVGSVYEEVLKTASVDGADLIVIGARRPDLKDFLLGPNAARIIRHSECSVFVVRD